MQIRPIHIVKHQKTFGKEESICVLKRIHRYSQNGTYGVDNASFAEKLLQKQEEMR